MKVIEFKLNMITDNIAHLINALHRSISHPLIRKYRKIPFIEINSNTE